MGIWFSEGLKLVVGSSGSPGPWTALPLSGILDSERFLRPLSEHSGPLGVAATSLSSPAQCVFPVPRSGILQGFCSLTSIPSLPKGTRKVREGVQESQCRGGGAEPREGAAGDAERVPPAGARPTRPGGLAGTGFRK